MHPVLRCLLLLLAGTAMTRAEGAERPNVIVILTDDQGSVDAGCYGATDLETPAIDSLAARGVRFKQFYAAAPVCSPSRAGLLTGRYPLRAGLVGNAGSRPGGAGMPGEQVTIAETFRAAGYATAHIGKWHLGFVPEQMPNAQGFDSSFGHMGGCIDNYSHFFFWDGPNRHDLYRDGREVHQDGKYFPDLMVEEASRFLAEDRSRPFFAYFAMNTPHYPYQGEAKWLDRYKDLPYPRNLYAAFVSSLDERIGKLLGKVDELGLRERTIVVFQSDHGHSLEERAHFGGGSAGPYRGGKFSMLEGGLRVPAIISWPGKLPEGAKREQLAHGCDWLPTVAELCEIPLLEKDIDGKSLVPMLKEADAPSPHEVVHWQTGRGPSAQWAVRRGDWKLIVNLESVDKGLTAEDKRTFLSNLADDLSERANHAEKHPEIVQELARLHEEWAKAASDKPSR